MRFNFENLKIQQKYFVVYFVIYFVNICFNNNKYLYYKIT